MKAHLVPGSLFLVMVLGLTASCVTSVPTGECSTDFDCGSTSPCTTGRCEAGHCVHENAPMGAVPQDPSFMAPACHSIVCDGNGSETVVVDTTAVPPPGTSGPCMRASCDASGQVTTMPDPTMTPPDTMKGDCMKPACDMSGQVTSVPADDPPTGVCMSYTCQSGQPVGTPADQGQSCSPNGFACGATGKCDTCPPADASCTDPGPGASAHALGSAHDFGTIGFCDNNEITLCGALSSGTTAYYRYDVSGGVTFCTFDPFAFVQASTPVRLCQYFGCPSVPCPAGTTPDTLGGTAGCCIDGAATSMMINPSCDDPQVFVTVEATAPGCTTFQVGFRS